MTNQKVKLSIQKDLLRKVKAIADQRKISLSDLLSEYLEEIVRHEEKYSQAQQRYHQLIEPGFDLGTEGQVNVPRDDLHER